MVLPDRLQVRWTVRHTKIHHSSGEACSEGMIRIIVTVMVVITYQSVNNSSIYLFTDEGRLSRRIDALIQSK